MTMRVVIKVDVVIKSGCGLMCAPLVTPLFKTLRTGLLCMRILNIPNDCFSDEDHSHLF